MAKTKKQPSMLLAFGTYIATVIGVGMFGLPYLGAQTGFVPLALAFVVLTPIVLVIHLRLADVVVGTRQRDRIPGYVARYMGKKWEPAALGVSILGMLGSILAYLIIGGSFLTLLTKPFFALSPNIATALFFVAGIILIALGTRSVAAIDLVLMVLFFLIIFFLFGAAHPYFQASFLATTHWTSMPLTYGVILFSLWGVTLVPQTTELVRDKHALIRAVLIIGTVASALLYLFFVLIVVGVNGSATTKDALTGLLSVMGPIVAIIAGLFGFIATFTSFISVGLTLKQTLHIDIGLSKHVALAVTIVVPALLYLIGIKDFIEVMGVTGAVLLGAEGAFVLLTADAWHKQKNRGNAFHWTTLVLLLLLTLGVAMELWTFWQRHV